MPRSIASDSVEQAAEEWFLRLSNGDMDEAELQHFKQWRDVDPRHGAAFEDVRALWNDIGTLEPAFDGPAKPDASLSWRRWRPGRGIGGAAALAACLLLFMASIGDIRVMLRADHRTARGEQMIVTLPDGSVAHLNTDSALDIRYTGDRREIDLLSGEVWFEVAKEERPFSVSAMGGRSTARGTAYAVRAQDGAASITVTDGTVGVAATDGGQDRMLDAGHRITYFSNGAMGPVEAVDASSATAWRRGVVILREAPFEAALKEIARYHPGHILLLSGRDDFGPVTARLSLGTLDNGIEALAATHGLNVTRLTDHLIILR